MSQGLTSFQEYQYSGDGSPEAVVKAPVGAEYYNLTGGARYRKSTGSHLSTGWKLIVDAAGAITASQISDASAAGKTFITATTPTVAAAQISDSTLTGRNLLTLGVSGAAASLIIGTDASITLYVANDWVANFLNGGFAPAGGTQTPVTSITTLNGIVSSVS